GKKHLLIVSDGALNYIPFAALPAPDNRKENTASQTLTRDQGTFSPLVVDHEIVTLPSASTLFVLRRELSERKVASKTLAVLADPVFEKSDERVRGKKTPTQKIDSSTEASADENRIRRLPYTRREADEILALVSGSDSMRAVDFSASRST